MSQHQKPHNPQQQQQADDDNALAKGGPDAIGKGSSKGRQNQTSDKGRKTRDGQPGKHSSSMDDDESDLAG